MKYIGIDPSLTATGVYVIDKTEESNRIVKTTPRLSQWNRLTDIWEQVFNKLTGSWEIAIEGVAYRGMGNLAPYAVQQIIGYKVYEEFNKYVLVVPPTMLKKFATGKGNAPKDQIVKEVYKRWGFDTNDHNIADAYVLARICEAYHKGIHDVGYKLTKPQIEVIEKLDKEKL